MNLEFFDYTTPQIADQLPIRIDKPFLTAEVVFLVTTQCNIQCTYCYNYHNNQHQHMDPALAVSFLKTYLEIKNKESTQPVYQFIFSGGEPTINPDTIFAVTDYLNKENIDCVPTLLTNGIMSSKLLERFIEEQFLFQVSFDGGNNVLRKPFGKVNINNNIISTIKRIAQANLPIVLRATVTQHNVREMPKVIEFAKENGVGTVLFDTCDAFGNALKFNVDRAPAAQYVEYFFKALKLSKQIGVDVIVPELKRVITRGNYQQLPKLAILPDGSLTTTTRYLSPSAPGAQKAIIGKYAIETGLQLNYDKLKEMVNNFMVNLDAHCKSCECYQYCRGRNQNIQLFREEIVEEKDEYRCQISRAVYQTFKTTECIKQINT